MTGRMHGSAQKKETEQVAWVRIILSILSLGYDVNLGWMSVFSSDGLKLSTIIANFPQTLRFPAKTQIQMCWHSKFPCFGLEPPDMIHLVRARGANLLLAGNSFQTSTGFHGRPSSRDSLEMALSRSPLLQVFCAPVWHPHEANGLKVACSNRPANYLVWAKGDCVSYQRLALRAGHSLSLGDFTYWTLHRLKLPAGEKCVWFFLVTFGALLCCVPC